MKRSLALFLLLALGCGQEPTTILIAQDDVLIAEASILPNSKPFSGRESKIEGEVTILNRTDVAQPYSNASLLLSLDGSDQEARAYTQSVASMRVDFAHIEIAARDSLVMSVYWIAEKIQPTGFGRMSLRLDQERLAAVRQTGL